MPGDAGRRYPLAMPPDRRAAFARQARRRFDAHERQLRPAVEQALGQYLTALRKRASQHNRQLVAAATPRPADGAADLARMFTAAEAKELADVLADGADEWPSILDETLMPAYRGLLGAIGDLAGRHPAVASAVQGWRDQWLTDRRQVLLDVPDQISADLRSSLSALAGEDGTDVETAREQVQAMLDGGYPQWTGRADLIARTETVSSNNQGSLAAWSAMSDAAGVGHLATKTWLATGDERTRQSHADLDGTTVGISDMFDVDGSPMNGPGDPNGDPGEICNCRCTLTYDIPDTDGGSLDEQQLAELADAGGDTEAMTAAAGGFSGAYLMLGVAPADAERIAVSGGEPPSIMHTTLADLDRSAETYGPEQRAALELALGDAAATVQMPMTAQAWAVSHFNPGDLPGDDCVTLLVQSPQLADLRDRVQAAVAALDGVDESGKFPIFTPHVTVGYGLTPDAVPPESLGDLAFDRLIMAWGDVQTVILGPPEPLTAAATEESPVTSPPPAPDTIPVAVDGPPPAQTAPQLDQDLTPHGQTWSGCLALLDQPSSDGRVLRSGGMILRPLPQTINWQQASDEQHRGNVVVGRVLSVEERDGMLWGTGDYLDPMICFEAQQAMGLVDAGVGMVSVDSIPQEISFTDRDGNPVDPSQFAGDLNDVLVSFDQYEFGGVTIMNFPAFADARIHNDPLTPEQAEETDGDVIFMPEADGTFDSAAPGGPVISDDGTTVTLTDGSTVKVGDTVGVPEQNSADPGGDTGTVTAIDPDTQTVTVQLNPDGDGDADDDPDNPQTVTVPAGDLTPAGDPDPTITEDGDMSLLAASITRPYPAASFARRELTEPTPLTIDEETGQVWGHAGEWGEPHGGKLMEGVIVNPPHTQCDYSYFHTGGPIRLDDGRRLPVGKLTVGGGHYMGRGGYRAALEHYDRTSAVFALVRAYEDRFGIQVCGHLVYGVKRETVEQALVSGQLSGDWRERNGNLEMMAAHCVVLGGFTMKRPQPKIGFDPSGEQVSLVAAGVVQRPRHADGIRLASGSLVSQADFDQLVAAAVASHNRTVASAGLRGDELAARRRAAAALRIRLEVG